MVRATRATAALQEKDTKEKDKLHNVTPPTTRVKQGSKKRKRTSLADQEGQPATKQLRGDNDEHVKEQDMGEPATEIPNTGDLPLKDEDAQKILDVLEMIDTQGLLDRVFPLPSDVLEIKTSSDPSTSKLSPNTYSLRTLLKESQDHPLRVLRSAIHHLFPISSQPRSRTSPPAAQQLRFCQLALSLLDQASINTADVISFDPETILLNGKDADPSFSITEYDSPVRRRKYALMQKLPGGDWWTSLNSDFASPAPDSKDLRELGTAYAELVSILPSPTYVSKSPPTLGDFYAAKKAPGKAKLPGPRHVSCGSFLDYGPYTSFAPSFDNDGCDVGRYGLGNVLLKRHERNKAREKAKVLRERMQAKSMSRCAPSQEMEIDESDGVDDEGRKTVEMQKEKGKVKIKELLECLLTLDEAGSMQSVLESLELEEGVSELLERNAKALVRLEDMQSQRLGGEAGGSSVVDADSEEWETAQKIMESLTILASLRPRSSKDSVSPLIPPESVLQALHRALPCEPTSGWYGTLSDARQTSLRDDTTVHVKSGAAAQPSVSTPAPLAVVPAPAQATGSSYTAGQQYPQQNYTYSNYQQPIRGTYSYPPPASQSTGYYSNPTYQQGAGTPQGQQPAAQYSHQYPYAGWYANYQTPAAAAASTNPGTPTPASNSGRGTPQPAAANATSSFAGYFATTAQAPPTRAVANTVSAKPQQNGWAAAPGGGYVAPTLPPHLRPTGTATAIPPATPQTPGYTQGFYPGYQTPSAGR